MSGRAANGPVAGAADVAAWQKALRRLDLALYAPLSGPLLDYVRYYGMDLEAQCPGVRHHLGWFEAGVHRINAHVLTPPSARGTVFFFHGYLDHACLYRHLVLDCLQQGYAVFIHDQPGHGLSDGERASIHDFSEYQRVLDEALNLYAQDLPRPFMAVGLSMGGAVVMDHVLSAAARVSAPAFARVLLLAPLLRPVQWSQIRFGWWLIRHFRPSVPRVFRRNSSDDAYLDFVHHRDPLQAHRVPMAWIGALRRWVPRMQAMPATRTPALLVQGGRDETVEWAYNNAYVRQHFAVIDDVFIPEASHQLPNERDDLRAPVHAALARLLSS